MKKCLSFLMLLCTIPLFATVQLQTSIFDIHYRGYFERVGEITIEVNGDDFAGASATNPVYIRLSLLQNTTLAETKVDVGSTPINLALYHFSFNGEATVTAPADAVSIVRWREGERDIWLRVTAPTSSWLEMNGAPTSPSEDNFINFHIGYRLSDMDDFNSRPSNIPSNSADTMITVNASQSSLGLSGVESLLFFEVEDFDATTTGVTSESDPDDITLGASADLSIIGDDIFGRAQQVERFAQIATHISKNNSKFKTNVHIVNHSEFNQTVALRPYDTDGMPMDQVAVVDIDAGGWESLDAGSLFQDISHLTLLADSGVAVSISYQQKNGKGVAGPVNLDDQAGTEFTYVTSGDDKVLECLSIVNKARTNAEVWVSFFDHDGQLIDRVLIEAALEPMAKSFQILNNLVDGDDLARVEIESDANLAVDFLRTDKKVVFEVTPLKAQ